MHLYPMTFIEFIEALSLNEKADLLKSKDNEKLVNDLLPEYTNLLRQYYFVGGMPEAVMRFKETRNPEEVRSVQTNIVSAYEADIAKHAGDETQRTRMVFQLIPSQLAKENKKFVFGALKKGARAANFEKSIQWLVDAGLVYKICMVSKVAMPLQFYRQNDMFKLYVLDVGLLGAMAQVPPALMLVGTDVFSEYNGAFTENYVVTQILAAGDTVVNYYSKENSTMEIDFVVQAGTEILPIEVKAEENVKSKSLRQFVTVDNAGSNMHGYRFSMKGYVHQDWMSNVPLAAVYPFIKQKE